MQAKHTLEAELLEELRKAHIIIRNAQDVMVSPQEAQWRSRNKSYSIIDRDPIRTTERRRLMMMAERKKLAENPSRKAINDVIAERHRQISQEGFTQEHDNQHNPEDLVLAGSAYAVNAASTMGGQPFPRNFIPEQWPFSNTWWKPRTPREDLIRAATLLISAIEHIDRNT